ncbi:MAG: hypothetical protein LBS79_00815 [Tannerella sp.]|jgi:uncharacterized pyridoxamine 5'-phosphate oxidase family protein|nr:hypothetical protein [Tannerella sp.]
MDILKCFQDGEFYYLSTIDGDKPQIRPMNYLMEVDGKLSFCIGMQENVFTQEDKSPEVAVCCTNKDGGWLRISGKVTFNRTPEARQKWLDAAKNLVGMCDGKYEPLAVCSFESAVVEYHPFGAKKTLDNTCCRDSDGKSSTCIEKKDPRMVL